MRTKQQILSRLRPARFILAAAVILLAGCSSSDDDCSCDDDRSCNAAGDAGLVSDAAAAAHDRGQAGDSRLVPVDDAGSIYQWSPYAENGECSDPQGVYCPNLKMCYPAPYPWWCPTFDPQKLPHCAADLSSELFITLCTTAGLRLYNECEEASWAPCGSEGQCQVWCIEDGGEYIACSEDLPSNWCSEGLTVHQCQ